MSHYQKVADLYLYLIQRYPNIIFSARGLNELFSGGSKPRIQTKGSRNYLHVVCDEQLEPWMKEFFESPYTCSIAMSLGNTKKHEKELESILNEIWTTYIMFI